MVEFLKNSDVLPIGIFLGCLLAVLVLGCWYIAKTTGRPLRDMLAVLAGGIAIVSVTVPLAILDYTPGQRHSSPMNYLIFVAITLLVWWSFNKLARGRSKRSRHKHRPSEQNSVSKDLSQ
jgi:hypothetical protein